MVILFSPMFFPPILLRCRRKACNHRRFGESRRQVGFSSLNKTPALSPVKLPALRADVPAPTAVKTPVLYPASSFVLGSCPKAAQFRAVFGTPIHALPHLKKRTRRRKAGDTGLVRRSMIMGNGGVVCRSFSARRSISSMFIGASESSASLTRAAYTV